MQLSSFCDSATWGYRLSNLHVLPHLTATPILQGRCWYSHTEESELYSVQVNLPKFQGGTWQTDFTATLQLSRSIWTQEKDSRGPPAKGPGISAPHNCFREFPAKPQWVCKDVKTGQWVPVAPLTPLALQEGFAELPLQLPFLPK